uniref:UMP-CMP kinase n=1 Tax=Rhipicephalus zambeziensis TaxID=60191 RepID=A0A224ZBC6_9ACAR
MLAPIATNSIRALHCSIERFLPARGLLTRVIGDFKAWGPLKAMSGPKPNVVFVLGPPGSGKGTQCQKLVERFGYKHLSAGDLLREEKGTPGSQFGEVIDHHIRNGTIVPVEITCRLLDRAMQSSGKSHFLIDGFPRNKDNLDGWNREMSDRVNLQFVLFLECPEEVCVQRCLNRGKAGSGRTDDNIESLRKRFKTYTNDTLPIVEYYDKQDLVRRADTSCNDPNEVFKGVAKHFEPYESTK